MLFWLITNLFWLMVNFVAAVKRHLHVKAQIKIFHGRKVL